MEGHWGGQDPAEAKGTPAEIAFAFKGCVPNAVSAHRHFYVTSAALAQSTEHPKQAARNRATGRRDCKGGRADVKPSLPQRCLAESLGTAFLLAAVVGSGIMAAKLAGGNGALTLLCNTLPTGAILTVLILAFAPVSGAHFNPAVTLAFLWRGEVSWRTASLYVASQIAGGV